MDEEELPIDPIPEEELPEEPVVPPLTPEEELIAEKISLIALMIGDIEGGPYYPMFTEDQYKKFLKAARGDVNRAAVMAAISAGYIVSSESSREVIGDLQISSSSASNYLKLLDYLISTAGKMPPAALMPWFAGQDNCDDNKLLQFSRCDPKYGRFTKCKSGC